MLLLVLYFTFFPSCIYCLIAELYVVHCFLYAEHWPLAVWLKNALYAEDTVPAKSVVQQIAADGQMLFALQSYSYRAFS